MSDLSVKTDMAEKIKNRRNEIRLRQQELADKIGVSVITISRWENPKSGRTPNASMLPKLAEALNTSVEYLMGLGDDEKPQQSQNLPINNAPEVVHNPSENLGLGYWGTVADNARKVAARGNAQEKNAVLMMLRMAEDAITGADQNPPSLSQTVNVSGENNRLTDFMNTGKAQ